MIRKGTKVTWKWGNGSAEGEVVETYSKKVTKTIDNTEIVRKGDVGNKALYIKQKDGNVVLKLESEVERVN
ncbi:hypervirulence associated TUDOR domain-containing protein [Polaribacter sp. OB-PA-B3]